MIVLHGCGPVIIIISIMSPPYGWTAWGAGLQGGGYVTCGSLQPTHTNTDDHDDPSIGNPDNLSVRVVRARECQVIKEGWEFPSVCELKYKFSRRCDSWPFNWFCWCEVWFRASHKDAKPFADGRWLWQHRHCLLADTSWLPNQMISLILIFRHPQTNIQLEN